MSSDPKGLSPSRGLARFGVVVPYSNSNLEPDMVLLRPDGVSMHFARAGGYDLDAVPDSDQMRGYALADIDPVLDSLAAVRPHVILYGCTSASLAHGPAFDEQLRLRIEQRTGVPAVTAAGAVVEALQHLGATRIAFASPYTETLNREATAYFSACNIEVVSDACVGADLGNYGQGELTPDEVADLGRRADHRDAEVLLLSCTDMRAVEVIERLEEELGKPVVGSNQALVFAAVRRLGIDAGRVPAVGRLLDVPG